MLISKLNNIKNIFKCSKNRNFIYIGYEWVGWRNDTLGMAGKPVEIVFEFDSIRNFSAIILHTNNMFTKDVQVIWLI